MGAVVGLKDATKTEISPPIIPIHINIGLGLMAAKKAVPIKIAPKISDLLTAPETVMCSELLRLLMFASFVLLEKDSSLKNGLEEEEKKRLRLFIKILFIVNKNIF